MVWAHMKTRIVLKSEGCNAFPLFLALFLYLIRCLWLFTGALPRLYTLTIRWIRWVVSVMVSSVFNPEGFNSTDMTYVFFTFFFLNIFLAFVS